MGCDLGDGCGFAEASDVFVAASNLPVMVRVGQSLDLRVGEFPMNAIDQNAQLASINEQRRAFAAVSFLLLDASKVGATFVSRQEPQAHRNLSAVEQLPGHCHHAVDEVIFDHRFANVAFAGLVGTHAAIGQDEARDAVRCEMMHEVLNPGKLALPFGGMPYFQRTSSSLRCQSESLNGGFARTKSAFRSL